MGKDILLVDDDREMLLLAELVFRRQGFRVHCASGGAEALVKLRERPFALMMTDLNMPGMNGLELSRRAREVVPCITIAMCTGNASPEILGEASAAGIDSVFAKPLDFAKVLAMVRQVTSPFPLPSS